MSKNTGGGGGGQGQIVNVRKKADFFSDGFPYTQNTNMLMYKKCIKTFGVAPNTPLYVEQPGYTWSVNKCFGLAVTKRSFV